MTYNWNVYKIFKSGKRAKAPVCVLSGENKEEVKKYFLEEHVSALPPKYKNSNWTFVRSDLSQERDCEQHLEKEKTLHRQKMKILTKLAIKAGDLPGKVSLILMYSKETNWKWKWVACEPSSLQFLKELSPEFTCTRKANEWLEEQKDVVN